VEFSSWHSACNPRDLSGAQRRARPEQRRSSWIGGPGPSRALSYFRESDMNGPIGHKRRKFLKQASAASLMSLVPAAVRQGAWAAGSDAPEKREIKIGFIPLTDCSSVVMASVMEFDKKYGIKIVPSKE